MYVVSLMPSLTTAFLCFQSGACFIVFLCLSFCLSCQWVKLLVSSWIQLNHADDLHSMPGEIYRFHTRHRLRIDMMNVLQIVLDIFQSIKLISLQINQSKLNWMYTSSLDKSFVVHEASNAKILSLEWTIVCFDCWKFHCCFYWCCIYLVCGHRRGCIPWNSSVSKTWPKWLTV